MGLSFRKSIRIGKNTRINFSKTGGIGLSTGTKGARVSINQKGIRTTVGKGGLQYRKDYSFKQNKERNQQSIVEKPVVNIYDESIVADLNFSRPRISPKIVKWLGISLLLLFASIFFPPIAILGLFSIIYDLGLMIFNREFKSSCMSQMAVDHYKKGEYEKSKYYCNKALKLFKGNTSAQKLIDILEASK
ncbi:DUF4236 domain-containing protein [Clostridium sp.]|uniref:DUF4236 domain-containing protein n=1 Tax=Clostridium sp. TaxID=1506 RepID=UPI00262C147C|nr:DUF4236 domain-containing protein [Clostridium sp.]